MNPRVIFVGVSVLIFTIIAIERATRKGQPAPDFRPMSFWKTVAAVFMAMWIFAVCAEIFAFVSQL
jgi:hypothetical protein